MTRWETLWQRHRKEITRLLAGAVVALLVASAALYGAERWKEEETAKLAAAQAALAETQRQFATARRALEEVQRHLRHYDTLAASGFTTPPAPVAIVEAILAAQQQVGLPSVRFALDPPTTAQFPATLRRSVVSDADAQNPLTVGFRQLTLHSGELHEGEWFAFLYALQQRAPGWSRVEQCRLARTDSSRGLDAECLLRWWFYPPQEKERS